MENNSNLNLKGWYIVVMGTTVRVEKLKVESSRLLGGTRYTAAVGFRWLEYLRKVAGRPRGGGREVHVLPAADHVKMCPKGKC